MKILEQIKHRNLFTNAELAVCDFIVINPKAVTTMTLPQLSKEAFTSQATIVRLCKKLGCKGFSEFKIQLAQELSSYIEESFHVQIDVPFEKNADDHQIIDSLYKITQQALKQAYEEIDINKLRRAARMIHQADSVAIYARGESLLIAEDFKHKLLRIGIHADSEVLYGFQSYRTRQTNRKEVAVIISHYVDSFSISSIFERLHHHHIPIILICGSNKSPLLKKASLVIHVPTRETRYKIGSFASRTTLQFVTDCIYGIIFSKDYEKNTSFIQQTELWNLEGNIRLPL